MTKISLLPVAGAPTGAEQIPVVQGGVTKRMGVADLADAVAGGDAGPAIAAAIDAHEAEADPHPQYLTANELTRTVIIAVSDPNGSALAVGTGLAYLPIPSTVGGKSLVSAKAYVTTPSSGGAITIQIHNVTAAVDMLSTPLMIDEGEGDGTTAATPAVIDPANDLVATGQMLRIDCSAAGAGVKGLIVELQFQ